LSWRRRHLRTVAVDSGAVRPRRLDFIVIGAQKAGTTSLWRYLASNERISMPPDKEAPFFCEDCYSPSDFPRYVRGLFQSLRPDARCGTVTPAYMVGRPGAPVPVIVDRIRESIPDVRLIALLRDPIERAVSAYRMSVQRGHEHRSFNEAVGTLLTNARLAAARREPIESQDYVVSGEYGRLLSHYLDRFPRDQLLIELTSDLDRDPRGVLRRVCEFIGVEPHSPPGLDRRYHLGGTTSRVSPEAERMLKEYFAENVLPQLPRRRRGREAEAFHNWLRIWNIKPDSVAPPVSADTHTALQRHYLQDSETLCSRTGLRPPWVAEYEAAAGRRTSQRALADG